MPPRSSSPICERSLDLTLIGIGRRDIPQCSSKHFHMEAFYRTFSGGQRPSWAHSPNGWLDARQTAGTPTGPATPATVFGGLTLCPSLGGESSAARSWRCRSLCVLAVRSLSRFSSSGFRRSYASRRRYPDNLRPAYFVWSNCFENMKTKAIGPHEICRT